MPATSAAESPLEKPEALKSSNAALLERAAPSLIFVSCIAYLCVFLRHSTLEPDEGIVLQGAERILHGELPYRDFFSFYTPGSFYLVAFLFRTFGDSFVVARASLTVAGAICSVVTYLLARRVCSLGISLFAAILATTAGAAFRFLVLHNPYSTLLCCLAVYAAVKFLETQKSGWAFAVGSLAALTFLTEQSKGAGLCIGLAIGFLLLQTLGRTQLLQTPMIVALALGFAWPLALTFGYFWSHQAIHVMLQSWLWPLQHYTQANHVPYGFQNWSDHSREIIFHTGPLWIRVIQTLVASPGLLVPLLPLIAGGILIYLCLHLWRRRDAPADSHYYLLTCSILVGLLASIVAVRADILHFMYLSPLWYLVLAWVLGSNGIRNRALLAARPLLTAYSLTIFGLLGMAVLLAATGAQLQLDTRRGVIKTFQNDTVVPYLQAHIPPGKTLLVYPYLPLYNYLTATLSPSPYDYFQPGMNTPAQAQEIVSSLETQQAQAILFEPWFPEKFANSWPGTPLPAIANDPVSDYIVRNYHICQMLTSPENWRFHYMVRKGKECP